MEKSETNRLARTPYTVPDKLKEPAASSWLNDAIQMDRGGQDHIITNKSLKLHWHQQRMDWKERLYLIDPKIEAGKDDSTASHRCKTCPLPQNEVREQDIEHGGQAPPDVVERDAHVPEAQVVECDHPDEDNGEGKHLGFVHISDVLFIFWMF